MPRKKYFLSSRAKRGICFSSRLIRKNRFLGQTPPFGMTWSEFFRRLLTLSDFPVEDRVKSGQAEACPTQTLRKK